MAVTLTKENVEDHLRNLLGEFYLVRSVQKSIGQYMWG